MFGRPHAGLEPRPSGRPVPVRSARALLGGLLCAGLVCGTVSPVWAAEPPTPGESAVVGGFGLGDGLEAFVEERDGALTFQLAVGGLALNWDSRAAGIDRVGFGLGWGLGLAYLTVEGGVRVHPTSGGSFELDAAHPSGLRGYGTHDVRFRAVAGQLPARDGASGEPVHYAHELHELGGTVIYFDEAGHAVASVSATGLRTDWIFDDAEPRRLVAVVDGDGVRTELDWDSEPGTVVIRSGANLGEGTQEWRVQVSPSGLTVVDPVDQETQVTQDPAGLVTRLDGGSGATTEVTWHPADDGVPRVAEIRTVDDASSAELSVRRWSTTGASPTGWPARDTASGAPAAPYETILTDGATRVVSSYDASHLLTGRRTETNTGSGSATVQELAFRYPEIPGSRPEQLPANFNRPVETTLVHHDQGGGQRSVAEGLTFDDLGRMTKRIAADGSVTETVYDDTLPIGLAAHVPVGLPVLTRTTTADGLVTETRSELNEAHTAVIATETFTGPAEDQLVRTGRTEYTVESDGFVSEKRVFPQGGAGVPLVARYERMVDLKAGTVSTTTTAAAGTPSEAHSSEVTSLAHGQVVEQTDVAGVTTTATYDEAGRPVSQTDAAGNTSTIDYETADDDGRNATLVTSPAAEGAMPKVTVEERDALGRATRITDNLRGGEPVDGYTRVAETREYRGAGTIAVTDAWGATTVSTKDALDQVVSVIAQNGLHQVTEYDHFAGTKTTGVTATGDLADAELTRTETVDVNGRTTATGGTRADGVAVPGATVEYDGLGRATRTTTGASTTTVERDAFGNPAVTTVAADDESADETITAERVFDEFGESVQKTLTDAQDSRTGRNVTYDELGRTRTETDQHGQTTAYTYTPDGLIASIVYADGRVTTNTHDDHTRQLIRTQTEHPERATVASATTYDRVTGLPTEVFDPANPADTTIRYAHDGFGNLTEVEYPDGSTISHTYDEHGRKRSTTDITGNTTSFGYTEAGLLESAIQRDDDGDEVASVAYTYDTLGRIVRLERGNGVTTDIGYTSASEVASETTIRADGLLESERAYTYDSEGRLLQRTDTLHPNDHGEPTSTTTAYTFDAHDRLRSSTVHDGDSVDATVTSRTEYDLNVSGDVIAEIVTLQPGTPDAAATTRRFDYELTGELTEVTTVAPDGTSTTAAQLYDEAGNLTHTADGTQYAYDAANRPITETRPEGGSIESAYWADGTRKSRHTTTADGTTSTTGYYWDGSTLINDTHTSEGDEIGAAAYLLGATRESRTTIATSDGDAATRMTDTSYFTSDRHGNIVATTDSSGAVTNRYDYTDYGVTTDVALDGAGAASSSGNGSCGLDRNPFRFAGEYTDCTGTQYLRARIYDAGTARFTRLDPTALHNRYGFADANPITNVDPSGYITVADIVNYTIIGATVLFGAFSFGTAVVSVARGASSLALTGAAAQAAGTARTAASWLSAGGLVADGVGLATATVLVVNDHMADFGGKSFLPGDIREGLGYLDYGLAGAGLVGALASAPLLAHAVRKGSARAATPATKQPVVTSVAKQPVVTSVAGTYETHPKLYNTVGDEIVTWVMARQDGVRALTGSTLMEQHVLFDTSRLDLQRMTPLTRRIRDEISLPLVQLMSRYRAGRVSNGQFVADNAETIVTIENSTRSIRGEFEAEIKLYPGEFQRGFNDEVRGGLFEISELPNEGWAQSFAQLFPSSQLKGEL